jgi:hypothetical protein
MTDIFQEDAWEWFKFVPEPTKISDIFCPECYEWTPAKLWRESETGCDTCGSHLAIVCPACWYYFDHVWDATKIFKVKECA